MISRSHRATPGWVLVLAGAATAVVLSGCGAPPGSADEPATTGIVTIGTPSPAAVGHSKVSPGLFADVQYMTGATLMTTLDAYRAAGSHYVRLQLIWSQIEPVQNANDWSQDDTVINAIVARGMAPLLVAGDTPAWAFSGGKYPAGCTAVNICGPNSASVASQFAAFVAEAAVRYSGKVSAIEVWNEPNNPKFWQPVPSVADYTALLRATYRAVKDVQADDTIVSGGLAPATDKQGGGWISPVTFLSGLYDHGGEGSFDAVGWHPYTWPSSPAATGTGSAWEQMANEARSLMTAHGDGGKKVWVTEFGAPTCSASVRCVPPELQAAQLQTAFQLWAGYSWGGAFIVYTYADTCSSQDDPECFFGLTSSGGVAKPALAVFRRWSST